MVGGGMERVCDVMAPRGLERLHTDTGYGDGSYLGLGQVLGHVLPDQRLAQLEPGLAQLPPAQVWESQPSTSHLLGQVSQ